MKKKYIIIGFVFVCFIVIINLFSNDKKNYSPQSTTTTITETTQETIKKNELETIIGDKELEKKEKKEEITDDEKFDEIYKLLKKQFGDDFMPMHYTKSGLNDELDVKLSADSKVLDCRNRDASNIFIAFSFSSDNEKAVIKDKLEKHKKTISEVAIIYEIDNYLFFISLMNNEQKEVLNIIDSIIK